MKHVKFLFFFLLSCIGFLAYGTDGSPCEAKDFSYCEVVRTFTLDGVEKKVMVKLEKGSTLQHAKEQASWAFGVRLQKLICKPVPGQEGSYTCSNQEDFLDKAEALLRKMLRFNPVQ